MKKLLAFILALSTALSLAACGGSTEEVSSESKGYTNTIQIAVDEALTALKNYDSESLSKYFEGNALSEQTLKATGFEKAKAIFSTFSWKLYNVATENDQYYLKADLTFVSLLDAMSEITKEMNEKSKNGEMIEDLDGYALARLQEMVGDTQTPTVTVPTEFIIKRVDGRWVITNGDILLTMFSVKAGDTFEE